jgi:CheY-like chemotaxis protein
VTTAPLPRLLIIDDCDANLVFVRYMMTALGADFDIARSETEAKALLAGESYVAVLIDHQPSRINALGLLDWMSGLEVKPRALVTTTDPSRQIIQRLFDAGCDHFLHRPLSANALCRLIPDMLFGHTDGLALAG